MSHAPAGLLLLVPLAGLRYSWPGLLAAAAAALAGIGALAALHLYLLPAIPPAIVVRDGLSWAMFLALTLAVSGGLLATYRQWRYQEEARWQAERANLRRLERGLTFREWQLLGLLTDRTLTYDQIGARLGISADTVKTHVRRVGSKLGVSGRAAISDATHRHGLLPAPSSLADTLQHPSPNHAD